MGSRFKYFKVKDVVVNKAVCGDSKFIIDKMYGNDYCPILDCHHLGEEKRISNTYLFRVCDTRLVDANERPLIKLKIEIIKKLMKKGNVEAKREFLIRTYNKKL